MSIQDDVWWIVRNLLVAIVLAGIVLRYFYLQQLLRRQEQLEMQARLDSLRNRILPHFLFNTLNSIASLIMSRPGTAEKAVEDAAADKASNAPDNASARRDLVAAICGKGDRGNEQKAITSVNQRGEHKAEQIAHWIKTRPSHLGGRSCTSGTKMGEVAAFKQLCMKQKRLNQQKLKNCGNDASDKARE